LTAQGKIEELEELLEERALQIDELKL